ncbi:DNA mismatch repair protein MutS [Enterovirga sp.]|uniref:MutS-related protein n=1 Tax=Enterovirga sp. TaxID=2026350 RepID=UPI002C552B67|nr:DNA mismatch repair protein MutS [Enterovirga sp.]HMO28060.1 DNA mismatch repair protein MutS [Enterovirga sp.]
MRTDLSDPRPLAAEPRLDPADDRGLSLGPAFRSVLFPPGREPAQPDEREAPACFADLNLDKVVSALAAGRDEEVLRPIFHTPRRSEEIVRYRQAVFGDLERPEVFRVFPPFCEAMRAVRADLAQAGKITWLCHRHMVMLRAAATYCRALGDLLAGLRPLRLRSEGLAGFTAYLGEFATSPGFRNFSAETASLCQKLFGLDYGMLFRGDKVTVRKYAGEPDYTVSIRERFARFREAEIEPASPKTRKGEAALNHIEEGILEFVGRLFPEEFRQLADYARRRGSFIDETVARLDREIGFFVAYLDFIAPLRQAGLPFCHPEVSTSCKETEVSRGFDLALAAKLVGERAPVVCNDFRLSGPERMIVVSGPNQGGKTTFARMFGQLHVLAGLGCPVPGRSARLFLPDAVFTHFEREEDIANLRGKLEDELVRLHESCEAMTANSVVILNEIFNSTSLDDQVLLSRKILDRILAADAIGVCVTFIDALSTLSGKTVSMVAAVHPEDPARRTFELVRRPADGLAYALSLAQAHGVTYERLRERVRP